MSTIRYEIDWCEELKFDANGDHDMDRETRRIAYEPTFERAIATAKIALVKDVYGRRARHEAGTRSELIRVRPIRNGATPALWRSATKLTIVRPTTSRPTTIEAS